MERCPNCGAPARPGAKFCTTCGYRLPMAAAVTPTTDSGETSSTKSSSWPAPPASSSGSDAGDSSDITIASAAPAGSDVIIVSGSDLDSEPTDQTNLVETTGTDDTATPNTDEVLSSSWPSTSPTDQPSPWATSGGGDADGGESGDRAAGESGGVSEETIVVSEPASQYEGWSSAVVEEVIAPSASIGTNIARATALLDELRQLLPVLNAGGIAGAVTDDSLVSALESAVASARAAAGERQALRDALNEARDKPNDIQTILALSKQTDAAIALLDDHERLIAAVEPVITERTARASGLYPSS